MPTFYPAIPEGSAIEEAALVQLRSSAGASRPVDRILGLRAWLHSMARAMLTHMLMLAGTCRAAGHNDWQVRKLLMTKEYLGFTLPKPVLKDLRDVIYFADIERVEEFEHEDELAFLTWPSFDKLKDSPAFKEVMGMGMSRQKSTRETALKGMASLNLTASTFFDPGLANQDTRREVAIRTRKEGLNMGRVYLLHFECRAEAEHWLRLIRDFSKIAHDAEARNSPFFLRIQTAVASVFLTAPVQNFFGFMILANFIINIAEASLEEEVLARRSVTDGLYAADIIFTSVFGM
jgi:hypothetical protein